MAIDRLQEFLDLIPVVKKSPTGFMWSSYDKDADTLYINFKQPSKADDGELTDDDIIVRYEDGQIVGLTILHVSKR
jgi:uncharacterized protein YuzE